MCGCHCHRVTVSPCHAPGSVAVSVSPSPTETTHELTPHTDAGLHERVIAKYVGRYGAYSFAAQDWRGQTPL